MTTILDASFLLSVAHPREKTHHICKAFIPRLAQPFVIPVAVIPEVTHLLNKRYSHLAMRRFVKQLRNPIYRIEMVLDEDLLRIDELLEQYKDARLDFADCSIVALAERLEVTTIATLDQRDFRMIRPKHTAYFTILPE